jgi:hypothetical protein
MPPKKNSSRRRRRNPKLLRDKPKHKSLRGGNKKELHFIPNVDAHVISVATFLRMYPRSQSQDQFYTILRKTKTFQCFYSFVNEVFGNMDEQLFSVLFLSFMITTSGETSSFSFKDFIIRAVPNIDAAQIDEIDAGMVEIVNGLSKHVYEECVRMKNTIFVYTKSGVMTSRMPAVSRNINRGVFHRRQIGGRRKIRKTRTNKKYVQTGGVLLFIAELITILFEIRRRINSNGDSIMNLILPVTLLLFFMLEISAQFSSIDYFGMGAGAPGGSAAATAGFDVSEFIAGASAFMEWLKDHAPAAADTEGQSFPSDFPGGYGSAAGIPSYASAQSTAAQRLAATDVITSHIFAPQLSAISAIQIPALEFAFQISPVSGRMTFKDFQMCLNIPDIKENASHIATLLRESQYAGTIPDSILDVPATEIQARLVAAFDEINDQFVRMTGEAGVQIQCARPTGRPDTLNDRLYIQEMREREANIAREECAFNGYIRLAATGTIVLSSKFAWSLLRRVYKLTGLLFSRPMLEDEDRDIGHHVPLNRLHHNPEVVRPTPPGAASSTISENEYYDVDLRRTLLLVGEAGQHSITDSPQRSDFIPTNTGSIPTPSRRGATSPITIPTHQNQPSAENVGLDLTIPGVDALPVQRENTAKYLIKKNRATSPKLKTGFDSQPNEGSTFASAATLAKQKETTLREWWRR